MVEVNNNYTPGPKEVKLINDINGNTGQTYDDLNRIIADVGEIFQAYPHGDDAQRVLTDASNRANITTLGFPPGSFITGITTGPILHGQSPDGRDLKVFNPNIGNFGLMRAD